MLLTADQVKALEASQSHYGCGNYECKSCYPIIYACGLCGETFPTPRANNGEPYTCDECGYDSGETY